MNNFYSLLMLMLIFFGSIFGKRLDFIDGEFDDFVTRIVQDNEKKEFRAYYDMLSCKMNQADETKQRATLRYLYDLALNRLQEKHAHWLAEIKPLVCDPKFVLDEKLDEDRKYIRSFLARYGSYEEFLNVKQLVHEKKDTSHQIVLNENNGVWHKVKSYFNAATDKITKWFGFTQAQTLA